MSNLMCQSSIHPAPAPGRWRIARSRRERVEESGAARGKTMRVKTIESKGDTLQRRGSYNFTREGTFFHFQSEERGSTFNRNLYLRTAASRTGLA